LDKGKGEEVEVEEEVEEEEEVVVGRTSRKISGELNWE
jgi:hypothetical protein